MLIWKFPAWKHRVKDNLKDSSADLGVIDEKSDRRFRNGGKLPIKLCRFQGPERLAFHIGYFFSQEAYESSQKKHSF